MCPAVINLVPVKAQNHRIREVQELLMICHPLKTP